ncbi:MAG: quinolinate synthase NadA [Lachnospiraceae bacterium]|jgi:quinolinate synthase|nr:quinolinate synthase NadA [Lachnospiraceae bacterium]MEE3460349.1 quinolinate synthase NadA [Lachnospiraceae bacterium]
MTTRELQDKIMELKKEKDFCILVHAYQSQDIWDIADYVGDSYGLSVQAQDAPQKNVIMSGVRFMAETVKTLSPEKTVYLANPTAGCPMAMQMDRNRVLEMREKYPDYAVVAYVNTTASLKTAVDVVVTSSSAVKILKNMPEKKIMFIPDCNLGGWVKKQVPDKEFVFFNGGCPTHLRMTIKDVKYQKFLHPDALLLVHPECHAEVTECADYVGSTTGIMKFAEESDADEFIIGTENSIVQHLQFKCPDKKFYPLSKECVCHNMKATTLMDIYNVLRGQGGEEIVLPDEVIESSLKPIRRMIELGG